MVELLTVQGNRGERRVWARQLWSLLNIYDSFKGVEGVVVVQIVGAAPLPRGLMYISSGSSSDEHRHISAA